MKITTKATTQSINEKDYTMDVFMSVEVVDRHGEIVDIQSLSFDDFLSNPVLQPFHDYSQMPVGKIIKIWKGVKDGKPTLEATVKFAVEEYEYAKTMFNLYKGGFMNAFSIGFTVGRFETNADTGIVTLMDCKLLELSCVAIPANQLALAKAKGFDIKSVIKAMPKEAFNAEVKELMVGVKEILEEVEEKDTQSAEGGDKDKEKDEDKPVVIVEVKKVDYNKLKSDILKRALEKAIRQL